MPYGSRKAISSLPQFLFQDEIRQMVAIEGEGFAERRDCMIMELLYSTGCRVAELVGVDLRHIDFKRRTIVVHGKGNKDRVRVHRCAGI